MAKVYVFGSTPTMAAEALTCVENADYETGIIITGSQDVESYKELGAEGIITFSGESSLAENYAKPIAEYLTQQDAAAFVVCTDVTGRDIAARVAGYLDAPMISEAIEVSFSEGVITTKRLAFGGSVVYEEQTDGFGIVGVSPGKNEPFAGDSASYVEIIEQGEDTRMSLIEEKPIEKSSVDLTKAKKIICAGMGFNTKEELEIAYRLAEALGAEVGCTRGLAENNGWFSEYIGLSGIEVKPDLYFSLGISGQVQHTVGIRCAQIVVAVTADQTAPILRNCDYGVIADMFDIADAVIQELK